MKTGHHDDEIWQVRYTPPHSLAHLDLELLTFAELRAMDSTGRRRRPQRPSFHVLALVESGQGSHRRDFIDESIDECSIIYLRPGVIHQWSDVESIDGLMVLFTPAAADIHSVPTADTSFTTRLAPPEWALARMAASHLQAEYAAAIDRPTAETSEILRHSLATLVLRASAGAPTRMEGDEHEVFRAYRAAVEEHFAHWRNVGTYAAALNYSSRTLSRATQTAAGISAKRFLDERVTLEAKRLLAHTDMTVQECADALGFTQATNFSLFFTREVGQPPGRWRDVEQHPHQTGLSTPS